MKNRSNQITALFFVVAFALAPIERVRADSEAIPENPVITIHRTDNVIRGKIGTFVLEMKPQRLLGGMYVKFSVGGTAIPGVDYVALASPAFIGQSGYAVIQIHTLANPRGLASQQSYSVQITLESGAGYALGQPRSTTLWIKP